jgi:hypothetical protein
MSESDLDEEEKGKPYWANFGVGIAFCFGYIICIMTLASLVIYTIKVGASNILPTDMKYDNIKEQVSKKVDANILREFSYHGLNIFNPVNTTSQKLIFNNTDKPFVKISTWLGPGFFERLLNKMFSYNNLLLNSIGTFLNGWNENILIMISATFYPIIFVIYFIFNWIFLFIDQFSEFAITLGEFFWLPPAFCYLIEFCICIPLIAIFSVIASFISMFTVLYSLIIVPFGFTTYNIQGDTRNNGFKRFFIDFFKYKTVFMTALFIFLTISNVFTNLGLVYALLFLFVTFISIIVFNILQTYINTDDDSQTAGLLPTGLLFGLAGGKKLHIV